MWGIEIGKPEGRNIEYSAALFRELDEGYYISRNSESYWVCEEFLNIGARVFVGSKEYDRLHAMLYDRTITNESIRSWIDNLILRRATLQQLRVAIDNKTSAAYREGRREAKGEVRAMLMAD